MLTQTFTRKIFLLITACIATVMFGFGCGGTVEQAQEQRGAKGTINFVEKDAVKGTIKGTYARNGYTIRFEAVRGSETPPEILAADPQANSHEIDARLCDDQGYCFSYLAGGHAISDDGWIQEHPQNIPDETRARNNVEIMTSFKDDLQLIDTASFNGLEEELQSLQAVSTSPPNQDQEYDPLHKKPQRLNQEMPQKGISSLTAAIAPSTTYAHYFQTWRESLFWPIAYHSSTWSYVINASGTRILNVLTCNHGSCPTGANMTLYCTRSFSGRASASLPIKMKCDDPYSIGTYHSSSSLANCCQSMYSYVPLDLSHVCNDDSTLQRDLMIAGAGPVNAPYCADRYLQGQAPYCW